MIANIKIGRIWGIPIGVNISWFFIFGLITWSLAAGYFPTEYPSLSTAMQWILGLVTSLLFFGSVLAHELGHSYLALRNKIPVNNITSIYSVVSPKYRKNLLLLGRSSSLHSLDHS